MRVRLLIMRVLLSVRANICTTRTKYALSKKIICAYAYTVCAYSYYAYRFIARTLIHISLTRIHISLTPIHISLINNALTLIHISPINIGRTRIHILPIDRHWEQKLCAFALALHSGKSRANHSIRCRLSFFWPFLVSAEKFGHRLTYGVTYREKFRWSFEIALDGQIVARVVFSVVKFRESSPTHRYEG